MFVKLKRYIDTAIFLFWYLVFVMSYKASLK